MRKLLIPLLIIPALVTAASKSTASRLFDKKLPGDKKTLHALNRLTFGPRSGDIEAVRKLGLKKWIDLQLNPSRIPESPDLLAKLKPLDTLQMPTRVMIEHYPTQQLLAAMARGTAAQDLLPQDPVLRARAERLIEAYKRRKREGLVQLFKAARYRDPERLADEVFLLFEGARISIQCGGKGPASRVVSMLRGLLAAGPRRTRG